MPSDDGQKSKLSSHSTTGANDKLGERITIFIKRCKNLVTQKPEGLTLFAKLDFNENHVAESPKYLVTTDNTPDFNFTANMHIIPTDPVSLDELAYKPLIITLIEILPKEKKQKEEKVQVFGQAVVDLFNLIRGHTDCSVKVNVYPTPGSSLETQPSDLPLPELDIKIVVDQPLLNEEELSKSNLLTINLDSMYSLPESWLGNANKDYAYSVALPLPLNEEKEITSVFVNGMFKAPSEVTHKVKRWPDTRGIQTMNALLINQADTAPQPPNPNHEELEEQGDFLSKEDREFRAAAEKDKPRIGWSVERRCFLSQLSANVLRDQITKTRYLPLEVIRSAIPTGVKGKRDEDLNMSYHGVVYIDMQPLLYPGATHLHGAYKIHPYNESDFATRTKKKAANTDDALRAISSMYDRNFAASPAKKEAKAAVEKKEPKKTKDANAEGGDISQSVQQMIDAKSFIVIDLKFDKPLIPRKPFEVLAKKVSELIPPRPKYPLRNNSAEKAVHDYHDQLKNIVASILEDYRNISGSETESKQDDAQNKQNEYEEKRKKLLYELNSTGKYFAFKEQLKNSVVKIVREKFLKTSAFSDPDEFQQFLSALYVFLVDEMHRTLNDTLCVEDAPVAENKLTDVQQMKHFAHEAELNQNYDLAAYYYQERIAREKDNYGFWLDYASFNMLIEDYARSEECLKECIAINPNEITGLLLYSVICSQQEKNDIATTFLERVTAQENDSVIAWTLFTILYEQRGEELNAEITLKKVLKLNQAQYSELQSSLLNTNPATNSQLEGGEEEKLKEEEAAAEETKAQESLQNKSRASNKRGPTSMGMKGKGESSKTKSPGFNFKAEDHVHSLKDKLVTAELSINKSIYMRTAQFLIKYNALVWAEKCMAKELVSPTGGPSCQYHIMLAKIKLAKNELDEAEKHCCEALSIDYLNYEAWIIWSHVRYLGGDLRGAKERYERVLLFGELPADQTHAIYIRLASIYLKEENYEDAKKLFIYPCKHSPSCMSWLGVGISCYRLDELEEARNALCEANILNNKAPEVWAYLSLICLRTNKPLEAEQAYKYAIKLNLDNPDLLDEIHSLQEKLGFGNPEF